MSVIFAMHKHLEQGSKQQTPHSGATFCPFSHSLIFSLIFVPVLTQLPASDLVFLSLSWLAGTPFRGQSPWVRKKKKNTRVHAHIGSQVNTCNHMQTQACSLGCRRILNTNRYTDEYTRTETGLLRTHTYTHTQNSLPKFSGVMPSQPTLDKPLCEPDKAGEGTQQPLNTGAGCIRQLSVPLDCIHTLNCRVLYPVQYESAKSFKEFDLNGFAISPLIHCCRFILRDH